MKSRLFISLCLGFCAFVNASTLAIFGAETRDAPYWTFNNSSEAKRLVVGQGQISTEFGLTTIRSTGTDCTVSIPMAEKEAFSASERPFFALRYKIKSEISACGLFFTNDDNLRTLSDKSYSQFNIDSDGEWHNVVVDMRTFAHKNWKGNITSFRLDPTNPSDGNSIYAISRLGFFPSKEEGLAFLKEANDEPDFSQDACLFDESQRCFVPGGALTLDYKRSDYLLCNVDEARILVQNAPLENVVVARKIAGGFVPAPLCDFNSRGFATFCAREPGEWRAIVVRDSYEDAVGRPTEGAIRFVLSRGLMTPRGDRFEPTARLNSGEASELKNVLRSLEQYGDVGAQVAKLAETFEKDDLPTREEVAVAIADAVKQALGTAVDSPYSREYFERERIRIGAWGNFRPDDYDEEYMKTYADCGFDYLQAMSGIPTVELLRDGAKYGVEVCVNDGSFVKPGEGDREYCDYPNYTGCYVTDEPGSDSYDKLAKKCNAYAKATSKTPYVNLLPMYANAAQLKYGAGAAAIEYYDADPDLFRKYCADFCKKFDTNYICTDIYPLNWTSGRVKTTYADYVESINVIASVAREYDREFWCYIQTFAWISSKRTPTEAEFRWQCYSMLSFGCRCILCWTYAGYEDDFPSLVDTKSRQTTAWHDARPVLWELRRISDEYVKYRNLGAFTHNCTEETPYLKMSGEYKDFGAIKEIECAEPLLVGCFEKKDESKGAAFTLVNMSELQENRGTTVRMKLQGAEATAWYRGAPQTIKANEEGWFDFQLASGEGVFVTIQ